MANTPALATEVVPVELPTLKTVNGHGMATSLQVAERFGKQHKTVLRAIENLACSEGFGRRNFAPSSYVNRQGKIQPMVEMTRDGFVMLAMGFTGPQAMAWKESFIEAFNQLEQAYIQQLQQNARALQIEADAALQHREFRKTLKLSDREKLRASASRLLDELFEETNPGRIEQKWNWLRDVNRDLGVETIPLGLLLGREGGAA